MASTPEKYVYILLLLMNEKAYLNLYELILDIYCFLATLTKVLGSDSEKYAI